MSQHLAIHNANHVLAAARSVQLGVAQPLLERLQLSQDNPVLLSLAFALPDRLDQAVQLAQAPNPLLHIPRDALDVADHADAS
jgi:hypothetical protein